MRILTVTSMYPTPTRPAFGIFIKEQVKSLRKSGLEVDVLSFDGSGGVKSYLKVVNTLRHKLSEKSYDLIHVHYGLTGIVARMQLGCPVVVTFHGSDLFGPVNAKGQYKLSGKGTTLISKLVALSISERIVVANTLKTKLWLKSAVTIPMGVDLDLFKPAPPEQSRERLGLSHDKKRVLFVAHPKNNIKRFDIAEAAVRLLQQDDPKVELVPLYNVSHQQVPIYMNACDVLVLTSMHEASPCVVKEAMACNLPVVSVDVGDVAERTDGVEGYYLCHRTPEDVAAKLRKALERNDRTNGREKIQSLSLQNIARQVTAVYEQLLASKRKQ